MKKKQNKTDSPDIELSAKIPVRTSGSKGHSVTFIASECK